MVIYITGDTHGDFRRFGEDVFPEQKDMTKDDYVIVCGDFGGVWAPEIDGEWRLNEESEVLDLLNEKLFTILFIDGNHENFDRLDAYPVETWHGGSVHKIRSSIIHLMRGQIYDIDGYSFFTLGGAKSHDIQGGVLDPNDPNYDKQRKDVFQKGLPFRILNRTWWPQETPTLSEVCDGEKRLHDHGNKVDFIITHDAPTSTLEMINKDYEPDKTNTYLEDIKRNTEYGVWVFGHYHINQKITPKDICLYEQIVKLI